MQGLGSFKSTLTRLYAKHHCYSLPGQIKPRALGVVLRRSTSKSRRGCCSYTGNVLDQKTTITQQYTSRCLFFHDVWITFLGFIVGLISHCCSRRALVERSLYSKWLTMSFPTSSIPAILFLNFADDALQVTSPKAHFASRTFSWRLHFCCLVVNATLLQLCGSRWRKLRSAHEVSLRFARQCGSQLHNESKQADQSSSPPQQSSHPWQQKLVEESDARATRRRSLS